MSDELSVGASVDVKALMADIHETVRSKRDAGAYPPEVVEELDIVLGGGRQEDDAVARALADLRRAAVFTPDVTTASRKPVLAPVASRVKGVIRTAVRWYMIGVLQQINLFAGNVVRALGVVAARVESVEQRLRILEVVRSELDGMRVELDRLHGQAQSASEALTDATSRLLRLDRAMREVRVRADGEVPASAPARAPAASWRAERSFDYFEFENHFRGSEESIRERQELYVDAFRGVPGRVVDVGCGRGEFLELLRDAAIDSFGVDRHPDMVGHCRAKDLEAIQEDALSYLAGVPNGSLGGIFSAQMIEHLELSDVPRFFELAADALAPGGVLIVETLNPRSLFVFAHAMYVDLGHSRPLHPYALEFLARAAGFSEARVEYLFPPPPEFHPQPIEPTGDAQLNEVLGRLNENFRRIDDVMFGPQDYAVIARR